MGGGGWEGWEMNIFGKEEIGGTRRGHMYGCAECEQDC